MGDTLDIRLAYTGSTPVAAILALRCKGVALYKYGCSDTKYKNLGAMPMLLWRAIENAKSTGASEFSLGRSDESNTGLVAFKNHWTMQSKSIVYWRYPAPASLQTQRKLES